MIDRQWSTLVDGLFLPEGLRWHESRLWFCDVVGGRMISVKEDGDRTSDVDVEGGPVGIGFGPNGRVLIQTNRGKIFGFDGTRLSNITDLRTRFFCVDMAVDREGRAYVCNMGTDYDITDAAATNLELLRTSGCIWRLDLDGNLRVVVAHGLSLPNGIVISPDGSTLVVAEARGRRLTKFRIAEDGSLHDRAVFAEMEADPDGICFDVDGTVWAAMPGGNGAVRVAEGGGVLDRVVPIRRKVICVALGGESGRTLFAATIDADESLPVSWKRPPTGRIECVEVCV